MFPYNQWLRTRRRILGGFDGNHDVHGLMRLWDERYTVPKLVENHLLFVPEAKIDFEYGDLAGFKLSSIDHVLGTGMEPEIWFSIEKFRDLVVTHTTYAMFQRRRQRDGGLGKPYVAEFGFSPFVEFQVDPDHKVSHQAGNLFYWFAKREPGCGWKYWRGPAGYQYMLREGNPAIGVMDDPLMLNEDD